MMSIYYLLFSIQTLVALALPASTYSVPKEYVSQPSLKSRGVPTKVQFKVGQIPTSVKGQDLGLNILLHGDGELGYTEFVNDEFQSELDLVGVAIRAPTPGGLWGANQTDTDDYYRPDGQEHSRLIVDMIDFILPQYVKFNPNKVYFTSLSGGSFLLSKYFIPMFGDRYASTFYLLCGGLQPINDTFPSKTLPKRIHFQSTLQELDEIVQVLPSTIRDLSSSSSSAGLTNSEINARYTYDKTHSGTHCQFDGLSYISGSKSMLKGMKQVLIDRTGIPPFTKPILQGILEADIDS